MSCLCLLLSAGCWDCKLSISFIAHVYLRVSDATLANSAEPPRLMGMTFKACDNCVNGHEPSSVQTCPGRSGGCFHVLQLASA